MLFWAKTAQARARSCLCCQDYTNRMAAKSGSRAEAVAFASPRDAIENGIGMVHQHFKLVEPFTVMQNMQLCERGGSLILSDAAIRREILSFDKQFGLAVDPDAPVWQLSLGEKQRVEIVRMLYRGSKVLILDEPTAVLTPQEASELFANMKKMAAAGCAVVFITHKLNEVQAVADRVTVLRGGKVSGTMLCRDVHPQELVWLMVGREIVLNADRCGGGACGGEVLRLQNVAANGENGRVGLQDVSFAIHAGQIFGIAGVAGNGQKELAEVLTGLRRTSGGRVEFRGENITNLTPAELIHRNISYVPEDRLGMGLVPGLDAVENLLLKNYTQPEFSGRWLIDRQAAEAQNSRACQSIQRETGGSESTGSFHVRRQPAKVVAGQGNRRSSEADHRRISCPWIGCRSNGVHP